ncbi:MAG: penicillin-binding protein 1C [Alphaproteobacteria bacterium]|jgi:penicillin-binding protein 1C|nr:penicillin-binding protein 1C [Alphaproteobacteria bacterium]
MAGGRLRTGLAAIALAIAGVAGLGALDRALPPDYSKLSQLSTVVTARDDTVLRVFRAGDDAIRLPAAAADVEPAYLAMLLAYEDRRFRWHPGIDPIALVRAVGQSILHRRIVSGASTLTMQVARLLEPRPRTLRAKLAEMLRALQLERRHTKDEILGMYLTLAPFGGNLAGVRAASLAYFGREPRELGPAQAALLVALPQSPTRRRPDRQPEIARDAAHRVLDRVAAAGVIDERRRREAREAGLPGSRQPLPMASPHLAQALAADAVPGSTVRTTLDSRLQQGLETLSRRERSWFGDDASLAVLVVDNATAEVRGHVGGDFFAAQGGQVDMTRASRSPGSTLKPFIYGLAFDDLLIHPETVIEDKPLAFGDYAPRNFDHDYHGEVTIRSALRQSLNLPAVAVLDRIGPQRLMAAFDAAGVHPRLPRGATEAGLPVALGGVGVSLADLARLYRAVAGDGLSRPLRYRADEAGPAETPRQLLGPVARYYLADVLADAAMPDSVTQVAAEGSARRIAYKTGTSYGFRDAWAIGWSASHTVAVWVGRPDGSPRPGALGRNAAGPIMVKVFDLIPGQEGLRFRTMPPGAIRVSGTAGLPPALQRFRFGAGVTRGGDGPSDGPRILFPPDGAVVELPRDADSRLASLALKAEGGEAPLRWLVNGQPVEALRRRNDAFWLPDGEGYAEIVVIDAANRRARADVLLR